MAATDIIFTGLWYLNGQTVSCNIAGLDCGDFKVNLGQITVPASSNASLNASYIAAIAGLGIDAPNNTALTMSGQLYIVPVTIGRRYTTKGQALRPATQADVKSQQGDGLGLVRRGHKYSFQLVNSGAPQVGTTFTNMQQAVFRMPDDNTPFPAGAGYSGVFVDTLEDPHGLDTMLTWQMNRPLPLTIAAASVFLEAQER